MTRDEILDAAAQIFSQKGFHATSMQDIAQAVNLQKGSLYHHINSKQEILVAVLDRALDLLIANMQDVLDQDYIISARAKGIKESAILRRHALRNAILPVVTITGVNVAFAVGGVIEAETVFNWPGVGRLLFDSVMGRDYPVLQGLFLIFAVALVLANLTVDLIYGYIDPRIKVGGGQ